MDWIKESSSSFWENLTLNEISGSLGDLGTFLPLLIGLVEDRGLDLGTTLIFTGIYNILSGLLFQTPIPVQPMKAIAAVALSEVALSVPEIMAAGIFVGIVTFVLGATRLINVANNLIPLAVVRGLQLGVGLNLAQKGVSLVWFKDAKVGTVRDLSGSDSLFLGLFGAIFILLTVLPYEKLELPAGSTVKQPAEELEVPPQGPDEVEGQTPVTRAKERARIPAALIIVVLGIILTLAMHSGVVHTIGIGPVKPHVIVPTKAEWRKGIWRGGVPQIPLTLLNSVIAVCQLSGDFFPDKSPSATKVATSVGLMNLVGPWFGALPCCHGAGGLAAQYRFGARSGVAPIFLGLVKLVLGLLFGSSLHHLLQAFPTPLLGAMLIFSGAELASTCRNQTGQTGSAIMLITTAAIMGMHNTGAGFVAGAVASAVLLLAQQGGKLIQKRRQSSQSQHPEGETLLS